MKLIQSPEPSHFKRLIRSIFPLDSEGTNRERMTAVSTMITGRGVHCECALISHLQNASGKGFHVYSYIGASKLSCAPCDLWVKASNNTSGTEVTKYRTSGTHKKWYEKWATPNALPNAPVTREMRKLVIDKLRTSTVTPDKYWGSDSRPASPTADDFGPQFNDTDIRDQILSKYRQPMLVELARNTVF